MKNSVFFLLHHHRSGKVQTRYLAGLLAGLLMLALAFWLHRFPQRQARLLAEARSQAIIQIAVAAAARPAVNVKNSLTILARLPVVRGFNAGRGLFEGISEWRSDFALLLESFEAPLASMWQEIINIGRGLEWWQTIPDAAMMRFWDLGTFGCLPFASEEEEEEAPPFGLVSISEEEHARISLMAGIVPETMRLLTAAFDQFFVPVSQALKFVSILPGLYSGGDSAASPVHNLLALMLDDGQIRALALKNFSGSLLAVAGDAELFGSDPDDRDCQIIKSGIPFFCGPVIYDQQQKRPVWWVAVPVRNEQRQPVACLSAMVDINFLSEMAVKTDSGPDSLVFTERSGVAIGHHDPQIVAQQVNLSAALLPIAEIEEKPISGIARRNDRMLLQTAASLKHSGLRHLPDWYVFIQTDLTHENSLDDYLILLCVILLAATGVYVLSCCVVRITNSSFEER